MQVSEIRSYRLSDDGNQVENQYLHRWVHASQFNFLLKGDSDDEGRYNSQHPDFPR